jgi:hypothetical protein
MNESAGRRVSESRPAQQRLRTQGPTPIWESKLYRERRAIGVAKELKRERLRRFPDRTLLQEKRALADHLLDLCEKAELALRRRGGDIAADLQQIDDLGFIVSLMDSEMSPGITRERLEELRDYLEAMVLAIEVARVAGALESGARSAGS